MLAILLASSLSGTYASGAIAARQFEVVPVHLVGSRGASLTEGLLVLRAAELAELGWRPDRIAAELARIRDRSGLLFTVDVFDNLLASGRVTRIQAWLGGLLGIKPILWLDTEGRIVPAGKVRGRTHLIPRILRLLSERLAPGTTPARFGIVHVGCPEIVAPVRHALRAVYGDVDVLDSPATPALAAHLGPGAWGVAYQNES